MGRLFLSLALLIATVSLTAEPVAKESNPWLTELAILLDDHFQPDGRLELSWARARPTALDSSVEAVLELVAPPSALARQMVLQVQLAGTDGATQEFHVIVSAQLWRDGWVLRAPAMLRRPVRPEAVDAQSFDSLRHRDVLVADLQHDPEIELDFARNLPAGRLVTWRDVIRRPLVRRNQPLEVVASEGGLTVSLRGIALHDAARGEPVRVRNPDSRKEFTAIVSDAAQAFVHF